MTSSSHARGFCPACKQVVQAGYAGRKPAHIRCGGCGKTVPIWSYGVSLMGCGTGTAVYEEAAKRRREGASRD
jgi:hypothetical protein